MKRLLYLALVILLAQQSGGLHFVEAQATGPVKDGPYIFLVNDELKIKWIQNDIFLKGTVNEKNFKKYKNRFGFSFDFSDLRQTFSVESCHNQCHKPADSIAVLADIHGEYSIYLKSLRSAGIIDHSQHWSFGTGHLVIIGDVFDRGDKVTEVLWHLYGLEKQAERAGGKVHVLLGNHELLVLEEDLRYIGDKYRRVEEITGTSYYDLYSDNSVLGHWLRRKPVMMTLSNILFVHGGVSDEMVTRKMSVEDVNRKFSENFSPERDRLSCSDEELYFLDYDDGPVWYRGYFTDTTFCESRIDAILDFYDISHIVVGHTPHRTIAARFGNKILGADTGMMYHRPGEMLLYKEGLFYRAYHDGTRVRIN
ncbi:MAG: metallophosphoesterase [Bacteroidota bacterium]